MERVKIKIKKNDIVKVISGASKGKEGKIINSDELTEEKRPTDLKKWRSWWGKNNSNLKGEKNERSSYRINRKNTNRKGI